jgi:redox-sensitive bicupin YhaK (pirin superfamily)
MGRLTLLASHDGREGSVTIHQDVALHSAALEAGDRVSLALNNGRHVWVQVVRGTVQLKGQTLSSGDGATLTNEPTINVDAISSAEVLLFDLA